MVALQHFYKDFAIVLHDITMEFHKVSTFPLNPSASFNTLTHSFEIPVVIPCFHKGEWEGVLQLPEYMLSLPRKVY